MAEKTEENKVKIGKTMPGKLQNIKTFFRKLRPRSAGIALPKYAGKDGAKIVLDRLSRDKFRRKELNLIAELRKRVGILRTIEQKYGEIGYPKTNCYIEQILDKYVKLGAHYDEDVLRAEIHAFEKGTETETRYLKIELPFGETKTVELEIPKILPIRYPDPEPEGTYHYLRCVGYQKVEDILGTYEGLIEEIRGWAKKEIDKNKKYSEHDITVIKQNIDTFCNKIKETISSLFEKIKEVESKEATELEKFIPIINELKTLRKAIEDIRPGAVSFAETGGEEFSGRTVRYYHTFNVVKTQIYDVKTNEIKELKIDEKTGDLIIVTYNTDTGETKISKPKKDEVQGDKFIREEWGEYKLSYDAYGHPLEVDEKGYVLLDKWFDLAYDKGNKDYIMMGAERVPAKKLDKNNWRKFPLEFIRPLDTLDVVNYIHNEWDEYRDDTRDGRYHPYTLGSIDYTMANYPVLLKREKWREKLGLKTTGDWYIVGENKIADMEYDAKTYDYKGEKGKQKSYRSYRYKICLKIPSENKEYVQDFETETRLRYTRDLSPGFDKRAYGIKWEYIGRKFYWISAEHADKWEMRESLMTTRGLSMYLINRIKHQIKEIEWMNWLFNEIGHENFDYGPRSFPKPGETTLGRSEIFRQRFQLPKE